MSFATHHRMVRIACTAIALSLGLGFLLASPASAAINPNCAVNATKPWDNDVYVYSTTTVTCYTTNSSVLATRAGNMIQEQAVVWVNRGSWNYNSSAGSATLVAQNQYYCNGHGTDNWRGEGLGDSSDGGETIIWTGAVSLTC